MNILDKIKNFNWMHFNDLGRELGTLVDSVKTIATDARKLGKDATAEQIASLITRVKALKDGSSLDELLSKILGQAESVFDEHADERAKLLAIGQKQSADLDAPQDTPPPPPPSAVPYGKELNWHPLGEDFAKLLLPTDKIYRRKDGSTGWIVTRAEGPAPDPSIFELDPSQPA